MSILNGSPGGTDESTTVVLRPFPHQVADSSSTEDLETASPCSEFED